MQLAPRSEGSWVHRSRGDIKCVDGNERHGATAVPRGKTKENPQQSEVKERRTRVVQELTGWKEERKGRRREDKEVQAGIEKDATIPRMNKTKQTSVWDSESDTKAFINTCGVVKKFSWNEEGRRGNALLFLPRRANWLRQHFNAERQTQEVKEVKESSVIIRGKSLPRLILYVKYNHIKKLTR